MTPQELVQELMGRGLSQAAIGRAVQRDSSLISQVAKGRKPGSNLRESLVELRDKLDAGVEAPTVAAPARRTRATGEAAKTRRKRIVGGKGWATGNTARQASQSGARSLRKVIEGAPTEVAATVEFGPGVTVYNNSGGTDHGLALAGLRGSHRTNVTMDFGDPETALADIDARFGGDVTRYVVTRMSERGLIGDADEAYAAVTNLEVRGW